MPGNKSTSRNKMARKRPRRAPSTNVVNPRRSDPEAVRARKLARLEKQLGPVNLTLGRTRQETRLGYVRRQPVKPRAAKVYHVSDPRPVMAILPIFHDFKNKQIRIVAYSGTATEHVRHLIDQGYEKGMLVNVPTASNVVTRTVYHRDSNGEWSYFKMSPTQYDDVDEVTTYEPQVGDHTYTVGENPNRVFKKAIFDWLIQYPILPIEAGNPVPMLHPGDVLKVYLIKSVARPSVKREQAFASGVNHCLIAPIIRDLTEKRDAAQSKSSRSNFTCGIRVLEEYRQRFSEGIPVPEIHNMVEAVSKKVHINVEITVPLAREQFLKMRNSTGHGKVYRFLNTQLDHVDEGTSLVTYKDERVAVEVSREEIRQIQQRLLTSNQHCEWVCDNTGLTKLWSTEEVWKCNVDYSETVAKFMEEKGFLRLQIDHVNDRDLSDFVLAGTHYNGPKSFRSPPEDRSDLRCYDVTKSYASFHQSRLYDACKFPDKLTHFTPTDRIRGPGLYLIDGLDFSQGNAKFVELMAMYNHPYRNGGVYAVPYLRLLEENNVSYCVTMGVWAGGRENTFDFRFTQHILDNKYYAMLVGKWNQVQTTHSYYMRGTEEMAGHILCYAPNATATWCPATESSIEQAWTPDEGTIRITYPRQHVWHLSQFTAYINAYEFVNVTDQLMATDLSKILQVQKDDLMCVPHEFRLMPYMRDKTSDLWVVANNGALKLDNKLIAPQQQLFQQGLMAQFDDISFNTFDDDCYISFHELHEQLPALAARVHTAYDAHRERFAHVDFGVDASVIAHVGAGGTGKTDAALRDPTRVRPIYISPSHKLSRAKAGEYTLDTSGDEELRQLEARLQGLKKGDRKTLKNIKSAIALSVSVWKRALNSNPQIWQLIDRYANTLVFDEVSMMWSETAWFLMQRFPNHAIVFAGDPGFQLAAYKEKGDASIRTPFDPAWLGIPAIEFTKIFRVKCPKLAAIRVEGRSLLAQGAEIQTIETFYLSKLQILESMQEVAERYQMADMVIATLNSSCAQWTELLAPVAQERYGVQKYHVQSCSRDYANGEILVAAEPPVGVDFEVAHAFTAHSTIGETARGKLFIDRRRMWETTHWETIVGRAQRWEDIYVVNLPDPSASAEYANCIIYKISSVQGGVSYIGHTTKTLQARISGHRSDKRCCSREVMKYKDWQAEVVEEFPCDGKRTAEARELFWIEQTPNTVNKNLIA